jgi:hypothetical protein
MANRDVENGRELSTEEIESVSGGVGEPVAVSAAVNAVAHAFEQVVYAATFKGYKIGGSTGSAPLAPNPY